MHHFFHKKNKKIKKPEHSRLHSQALRVWGVFEELWVMAAAMWHGVSASYFRVRAWDKVLKGEECWAVLVSLDAQWMSSPLIIWLHPLKHLPCNVLSFSPTDPDLSAFFSVSLFLHGPHSSLFSCRVYIPVQSASPRGGWLYLSSVAEPLSRGSSRLHDSYIWIAPLKYGFFFSFLGKRAAHIIRYT